MNTRDDWRLDKIEIEFKSFGNDKGKYVGSIRFQNGEGERLIESLTLRDR